jgi:hypothetical protein
VQYSGLFWPYECQLISNVWEEPSTLFPRLYHPRPTIQDRQFYLQKLTLVFPKKILASADEDYQLDSVGAKGLSLIFLYFLKNHPDASWKVPLP